MPIDQATRLCRRGRRRRAAALERAEAAACRRARHARLRTAGAAAGPGARPHGAARHQGRSGRSSRGSPASSRRRRRRVEAEIYEIAGESFNIGSPKQLGDILFGKMGLAGGKKTKTGQWSTDVKVLEELAAEGVPHRAQDRRLAAAHQAEVHLYRRASPATSIRRPAASTPTIRSPRPRPGGSPRSSRTCRTSRSAPRRAAPSAAPSSPSDGLEPRLRRLQPDRAARARAHGRHPAARAGFRGRPRHPRDDGVGDVRRAGRGHGPERAPPRQGDQFRHHLRHLRLRARRAARHPARRGGATTSTATSSASPASATTWTTPRRSRASISTWRRCSGGARTIPTSAPRSLRCAPSRSARRSTRRSRARPPTSSAAP